MIIDNDGNMLFTFEEWYSDFKIYGHTEEESQMLLDACCREGSFKKQTFENNNKVWYKCTGNNTIDLRDKK